MENLNVMYFVPKKRRKKNVEDYCPGGLENEGHSFNFSFCYCSSDFAADLVCSCLSFQVISLCLFRENVLLEVFFNCCCNSLQK